jgi:hypothetical protein
MTDRNLHLAAQYRLLASCFREHATNVRRLAERANGAERARYELSAIECERAAARLESEADTWATARLRPTASPDIAFSTSGGMLSSEGVDSLRRVEGAPLKFPELHPQSPPLPLLAGSGEPCDPPLSRPRDGS